ncbi:MAG: type II toxin-antitoxin system VapC family toxin [Sandaracinobacteroides sp.]
MIAVDTNVWSELTRTAPSPVVIDWEATNSHQLWMPTIALAEFRARAALMPAGQRRDAVTALIEAVVGRYTDRLLDFDEKASHWFGIVVAGARAAGRPISTADAMIAATARAHGMSVATRDVNDFAGAGVEIVNPWAS